jgi:metal-responsive CopG/Arc/MetJ family transcriptional regulator
MERVTIKIPKELYKKLKDMIEGTGFTSVTDFIEFVMRTVASGGKLKEDLAAEEIEMVRKRLKALGYLK